MQETNWTGNIRELRNVVERLMILFPESVSKADVEDHTNKSSKGTRLKNIFQQYDQYANFQEDMNKQFLHYYLTTYEWKTDKVAKQLGIDEDDLKLEIKKLKLLKDN